MSATNSEKNRGTEPIGETINQRQQAPSEEHSAENREHHLDKTIEDSFPASDPPSTDPNPDGDE